MLHFQPKMSLSYTLHIIGKYILLHRFLSAFTLLLYVHASNNGFKRNRTILNENNHTQGLINAKMVYRSDRLAQTKKVKGVSSFYINCLLCFITFIYSVSWKTNLSAEDSQLLSKYSVILSDEWSYRKCPSG